MNFTLLFLIKDKMTNMYDSETNRKSEKAKIMISELL